MIVDGKILFDEHQYFRVKWVWVLLLCAVLAPPGIIIGLSAFENEGMTEGLLALTIVVPLEAVMLYLFYIARLDTIVTTEGVYYRWWPFQRKGSMVPKGEIDYVAVRKAPALQYGKHWLPGYGWVNSAGPGEGLQFELANGKKIFIGSATPDLFRKAVSGIAKISPSQK